ncbi:uncharacterized protein LOC117910225 [Vitis riparia]|uniref:uncharacterized protein LOC117910225 n=1 Tax=Vitis riparia TaxID=96939 RepID=UPI00155ADBC6|nr:uncharacterized protein LOC117910225 [Vitis riparia]
MGARLLDFAILRPYLQHPAISHDPATVTSKGLQSILAGFELIPRVRSLRSLTNSIWNKWKKRLLQEMPIHQQKVGSLECFMVAKSSAEEFSKTDIVEGMYSLSLRMRYYLRIQGQKIFYVI